MKLAVVNDWYDEKSAVLTNQDGFLKSLQVLQKWGWEVIFFKKHKFTWEFNHPCVTLKFSPDPKKAIDEWNPDAVLFFCDFSRPLLGEFENSKYPIALCLTGGLFEDYEDVPHIIFVESKSYLDRLQARGRNAIQAFGTNTELFKPIKQPKVWDAIFPATFAGWKRHNLFAEAVGNKGLAVGYWQPHEMECVDVCFRHGTAVLHHQGAESTALLYNMAKTCVVTSRSDGGSQRTVLEALASNIPVIVTEDSEKTSEYIRECGVGAIVPPTPEAIRNAVEEWKDNPVNTRDWILKNYSETIYAKKLKEGIESIM